MKTVSKTNDVSKSKSPEVTPAIQLERPELKEFTAVYKISSILNEYINKNINKLDQVIYINKNTNELDRVIYENKNKYKLKNLDLINQSKTKSSTPVTVTSIYDPTDQSKIVITELNNRKKKRSFNYVKKAEVNNLATKKFKSENNRLATKKLKSNNNILATKKSRGVRSWSVQKAEEIPIFWHILFYSYLLLTHKNY